MPRDRRSPRAVELGALIRRRRQSLGMTQEQLAVEVGVRQSDISHLELGRVSLPRKARLRALADALDVPIGDLLLASGWMDGDESLARSRLAGEAETVEGVFAEWFPDLTGPQVESLVRYARFLREERASDSYEAGEEAG